MEKKATALWVVKLGKVAEFNAYYVSNKLFFLYKMCHACACDTASI